MDRKQWGDMSKSEKLDYLHERIQTTDVEVARIRDELGKAVMRFNSRLAEIEKLGNKKYLHIHRVEGPAPEARPERAFLTRL